MPNGKPDPGCEDCKGTGQITLFTSVSECECVNSKPSFAEAIDAIKDFGDKIGDVYGDFEYFQKEFEIQPLPTPPQKKFTDKLKKLQLSADYIANGILTWCTWPGIEGHTCNGCGAEMNVLGM